MARELNQRGIPNSRGKPWSRMTVHWILQNEIYIGNLIYNRQSRFHSRNHALWAASALIYRSIRLAVRSRRTLRSSASSSQRALGGVFR
ncbi:MAG: recombinase family protein [Bradyrhizobium sp.]